ncbi:MAG: hypothetical protein PHS49_05505 [Candidatus Gracilibacteria bacterium]|nr:hypothetical protein [Candidatus Gracilibacteria bacterium]
MKKGYQMIVKAIEVTKKYSDAEVKQLSGLFSYLNNIDIDEEGFGTGISAKGLWKLLNPLTKNLTNQTFEKWWLSVSNTAGLKDNIDYEKREELDIQAKSTTSQKGEVGIRPVKKIDFILTLRAGEYCAVLTKGDSGDLYRRFIFDIKDEFLRLVFRQGRSIETRNEFTKSIGELEFMKKLKELDPKEVGGVYGEMTNLIYLELFGVTALEFKEVNNISKKYFAKDFFTKDGLFDLEKVENKLAVIISYLEPKTRDDLKKVIIDYLNKEVKITN